MIVEHQWYNSWLSWGLLEFEVPILFLPVLLSQHLLPSKIRSLWVGWILGTLGLVKTTAGSISPPGGKSVVSNLHHPSFLLRALPVAPWALAAPLSAGCKPVSEALFGSQVSSASIIHPSYLCIHDSQWQGRNYKEQLLAPFLSKADFRTGLETEPSRRWDLLNRMCSCDACIIENSQLRTLFPFSSWYLILPASLLLLALKFPRVNEDTL